MTLCAYCNAEVAQPNSHINRALRKGHAIYCDRKCAGLSRRLVNPPTKEQKIEAKRLYDAKRREEKRDVIKAKKAEYFRKTYDPVKAHGDAVASQAREILRTVKVQLQITSQAKRSVPADLILFAEK